MAANCKGTGTYKTCRKEHRMAECEETDSSKFKCVNCDENGHASWDCTWKFTTACKKVEETDPENMYKYFPNNNPCVRYIIYLKYIL